MRNIFSPHFSIMSHACAPRARKFAAGLALSTALSVAPAAFADPELEARVAELEALVAALTAQIANTQETASDAKTASDETLIRLKSVSETLGQVEAARDEADAIQLGKTQFTYGGLIDIDYHLTNFSDGEVGSSSIVRDFYIPGATPVGGEDSVYGDFTAQASRFYFKTNTPTEDGDIKTLIEFDFLASVGGNERVSNSYNPRMRRAFVSYGNWLVGQEWTTFQNLSTIPESVSFLIGNNGMAFNRQPMVRYTNGNWQFALENGNATVTPFGGGARIEADDNSLPDAVARYNHSGSFGNISVAAIARQLSYQQGAIDSETFGWGLSFGGRLNVSGGDLRFMASAGEGMGRLIGLNTANSAVVNANGELEAIPSYGGLLAYRRPVGEGRRFNIGYSFLEVDNDLNLTAANVTESTSSGFANFIVDVAPKLSVGAEVLLGDRTLENGQTGNMSRLTLSTKYSF